VGDGVCGVCMWCVCECEFVCMFVRVWVMVCVCGVCMVCAMRYVGFVDRDRERENTHTHTHTHTKHTQNTHNTHTLSPLPA
jgi:hypothetical protein